MTVFKSELTKEELSASWKKINSAELIKKIEVSPKTHSPVYWLILAVEKGSQAEALGVTAGCKFSIFPREEGPEGRFHWIDREGKLTKSPSELADTMKRSSWLKRETRMVAAYWDVGSTTNNLLNDSVIPNSQN